MDPIQVDAVLLRGMLPDIRIRPGLTLPARVLERHAGHGLLNLAGTVLVAELPPEVQQGQRLRLAVQEVGAERVVLQVLAEAAAEEGRAPAGVQAPVPEARPAATAPGTGTLAALPLPGGDQARVSVVRDDPAAQERQGGGDAGRDTPATVTLHYDSPTLGRLELRLVLGASGLVAGVRAAQGRPQALAAEHAAALREALGRLLGRPVEVHVGARRDAVDVRA